MVHDSANPTLQQEARKLDRLVSRIAHFRHIRPTIAVIAFLEAIISPILPELVVAAVLTYRKDLSWKLLSLISAFGSALGAGTLYLLGKVLYARHTDFFDALLGSRFGMYGEKLLEHNTFISVFLAAFTPLPDRVFAFLSGLFNLSLVVVFVAFFIGRLVRVGIVAYFSFLYGDEARAYILKHTRSFTIAIIGAILAYIALKYLGIL